MIGGLIGGIGLFLLGMALMTDGVKSIAGDAARRAMSKLAGGRLRACALGVTVTTLAQSSSATTIMTIGFVSAGLIPLSQAIAVVIGANIGTTTTGWIVALLGIKVNISSIALPLVGVGALIKLFSRDRLASLGLAIAGFGLIFVGIGFLKDSMAGIADNLEPGWLALSGFHGQLILVAVGVAMTVLTQSSSAAMATTLSAMHSGAINLEQGAALAIGQNIGTTVTAALAAIGAKSAARRTAAAHILFNFGTGCLALGLLWLLSGWIARVDAAPSDGVIQLAVFHTAFNLLGAAIFLPLLGPFTWLVTKLIHSRGPNLTRRLDRSVAATSPVAIEASRRTARACLCASAKAISSLLRGDPRAARQVVLIREEVDEALKETRRFLSGVRSDSGSPSVREGHIDVLHAIDHLDRLAIASVQHRIAQNAIREGEVRKLVDALLAVLHRAPEGDDDSEINTAFAADAALASRKIAAARRERRPQTLAAAADGSLDPESALARLEVVRWIDRVAFHTARTAFHLAAHTGRAQPAPHNSDSNQSPPSCASTSGVGKNRVM